MNKGKSVCTKLRNSAGPAAIATIVVGLLLVTLNVDGQRRRSRQRSTIKIPSINTSNTTLRNSLCTSPFSKQRVVGQCKPLVKCSRFFHQIPQLSKSSCRLLSGEVGVCCPYVILGPVRPQSKYSINHIWCLSNCFGIWNATLTIYHSTFNLWYRGLREINKL